MAVNKPLYIIDASVILKWFLEEAELWKEQALELRDDFLLRKIRLIIPPYTTAEILNVMGRELSKEHAIACFSNILLLDIEEICFTIEYAAKILEIMNEFSGVSFYDAGYHALAFLEGGTFITADSKYFQRTKNKGKIIYLKDYAKKR